MQFQARLAGVPLHIVPFTALQSISGGAVSLRHIYSGELSFLNADVVVAVGLRVPRTEPVHISDSASVRIIGDAVIPRRVSHAVSEGRRAGLDVLAGADAL